VKVKEIAKLAGVGNGTIINMLNYMSVPIEGIEYEGIRPVYIYSRKDALKVVNKIKAIMKKQKKYTKLFLESLK
jgi:hypothetical protein